MHRPRRRRLYTALVLVAVAVLAACSLDEAELVGPDVEQVDADPGQLRVLTYADDPEDQWIDAISPDPEVYTEGDEFREDDSRAAEPDELAERRRLFTAVEPGRTLLVELNCPRCGDDLPRSRADVLAVHVWDLVVDDASQEFSAGTPIARAGEAHGLAVGEPLVVVHPAGEAPAVEVLSDGPAPVQLVASYTPADGGADLFVDVFVADRPGDATLVYDAGGATDSYSVTVG